MTERKCARVASDDCDDDYIAAILCWFADGIDVPRGI